MSLDFECCICMENFTILNEITQLVCTHVFCSKCVNKLSIHNNNIFTCPLCREKIQVNTKSDVKESKLTTHMQEYLRKENEIRNKFNAKKMILITS